MSSRESVLAVEPAVGSEDISLESATVVFETAGTVYEAIPKTRWHDGVGPCAGMVRIGGVLHVIITREPGAPRRSIAGLLTARELQIALLIAEGKCDKSVAREIGISENTVREHLRRSFAKLGIDKRTSLVALVVREQTRGS